MTDDELTEALGMEVRKLQLAPDDVVVITFPGPLPPRVVERLGEHWKVMREGLGLANKLLILDSGAQLSVLTPAEAEAEGLAPETAAQGTL